MIDPHCPGFIDVLVAALKGLFQRSRGHLTWRVRLRRSALVGVKNLRTKNGLDGRFYCAVANMIGW